MHEARRRGPIPLLWSIIGGSAAFTLGIRPDLALIVAGGALLARIALPVEAAAQAPR